MGQTAHARAERTSDNRSVTADTDALIGTVQELAAEPSDRGAIEEALTIGYAQALSLEAERLRLDRRITALAAGLVSEGTSARVAELGELARRRTHADGELTRLREALLLLRARLRSA
jgi:ABC-type phosphate transport system auxiliary subunit